MKCSATQLRGSVILLAVALIMYIVRVGSSYIFATPGIPPWVDEIEHPVIVELSYDQNSSDNIYFLRKNSRVSDLVAAAGIDDGSGCYKKNESIVLKSGDKVVVRCNDGASPTVALSKMADASRYVCDLPMDVNTASADDLRLIPGVGVKTAEAIVRFRKEKGPLEKISELMKLHSIGDTRFRTIRKYVYIES